MTNFVVQELWNDDSQHNWGFCGDQKYGSGICEYAPICNAPSKQLQDDRMKLYHIKPIWNPWAVEKKNKNAK